jgi:hypothetical protein
MADALAETRAILAAIAAGQHVGAVRATDALAGLAGLDGLGWQPIETAPKDGTEIEVLSEEGDIDQVRWELTRACVLGARAGAYGEGWESALAGYLPVEDRFTHWQPLSAPPASTPQEGGE